MVSTNLHTLGMVIFLIAVDVIVCYFLLTNPAHLLSLAVTLAAAGLVLSHEEYLAQLHTAVFAPGEGGEGHSEVRLNV